ncbi:DNA/RNA non-specific endonuclease [Kibdelosporangium aridum]|uniref:DNA/RNA non-specific endonuclease n=1 Tax=Kibdelosporangium aridum TaxID=2030 RepID=A0A1Y5Y7H7_KIBAR|nr:DNA/RNA non-specific endonuclease [Kibdelosporangium aridum]SMD25780.1 DNA/RNA non-specific endonuclease [Kibdelosporangium aridum]
MKKLPKRPVILAVVFALLAGIAGQDAVAAPPDAPARPAVTQHQQAAAEPDPEMERLIAQLERDLIADIAGADSEDEEVRAAAREALRKIEAGDRGAYQVFFDTGYKQAKAQAKKRKEAADAANRAQIEPLRGTGGPAFRAAVERALQGDAWERESFLAYGRDLAAEQDRKSGAREKELADRRRSHVEMAAALGGPEVSAAAKAALAQGDAAIAEFLRTGYLAAAQRDAENREKHLAELERQRKEAEAASELAQRTARAMRARQNLLAAHADGVKALERTANDMTSAANASREAARVLAADLAGGTYHPELYQRAKDEVARQLRYAVADAEAAQQAAAGARTQAAILVENQMPHGTQWAKVVEGMAASAEAAKQAAQTAVHAVDAIAAEAAATDATEKAKAHAENAKRWRETAESHAASAAKLAAAAKEQALAAADAAARAKQARAEAEAALRNAQTHAANVKQARADAERERDVAAAKRAEAERWRDEAARKRAEAEAKALEAARHRDTAQREAANADQKRQEAEAQQRIAAQKRQDAQAQEQIAADASKNARAQEKTAMDADRDAQAQETKAHQARENAAEITRSADTLEKKAQALEELARRASQATEIAQADKDKAWAAAHQARAEANTAREAARQAQNAAAEAGVAAQRSRQAAIEADAAAGRSRAAADAAQAAASAARAAANEAEAAAEKSRAAANEAQAAAARADHAADRAESEAAAVHAEAMRANAAAEEATAQEARAADNARKAVELANQAAWESAKSLDAARRTQDEANASAIEAATAATQAGIATRAAAAARLSSSGIADPANRAIELTSPFSPSDVDADFAAMVAARAKDVGNSQVEAANQAAQRANEQAQIAAKAAREAAGEAVAAFQAASAAANSAAEAARSAAAAQVSAAEAAVDAAAARAAAAQANALDAEAQADARAARAAANQAAADAALAGRAADKAEADARAARQAADQATRAANEASAAATRAEQAAAAAKAAADQAQIDAEEARKAAERAQQHARDAEAAAKNAEDYAKNAEKRAENSEASAKDVMAMLAQIQEELRKENEERQRREVEETINDDSDVPELTAEEEDALRKAQGQAAVDEYRANRAKANKKLETFIVEQGGQILLDLIGLPDAKRCFVNGDFISCVMTVINALPILKLARVLTQIPDAVSATIRIVKGLRTFKDVVVAARKTTKKLRDAALKWIRCNKGGGGRPAADCDLEAEPEWDPHQPPYPDPRPDPYPWPGPAPVPAPGVDTDKDCPEDSRGWIDNDRMQTFDFNGGKNNASRATGGTACIIRILPREAGDPYTPVGYNSALHNRGHLIGSVLGGSNRQENIVLLYIRANEPVMRTIEGKIDRAVRNGEQVYLRVSAWYRDSTAYYPEKVYIKAWGMKKTFRCIALIQNIPHSPSTECH